MGTDCIFCKIINKEITSEMLFESDDVIVIRDINPKAPLHLLIIPKKHIASVNDLGPQDRELIGDMILAGQEMAKEQKVDKSGYRLNFNTGKDAGQTVDHIHLHLLAGEKLPFA